MHLLWAQMMGVRGSAARSLHPIGNRFPVRPIVMRIRAAHGCSQQYRSDSSDHLHSLCGLLSWNDAEPWELSSFQLKSTLDRSAAASLMPTARLNDVMLCLSHPMGKRDFTTNLRSSPEGSTNMTKVEMPRPRPANRLRLAPRVWNDGSAAKLNNEIIAQFLSSSVVPPTPAHAGGRIHMFGECSMTPVVLTIGLALAATQASR